MMYIQGAIFQMFPSLYPTFSRILTMNLQPIQEQHIAGHLSLVNPRSESRQRKFNYRNLILMYKRQVAFVVALLSLSLAQSLAQTAPPSIDLASPPIADPRDNRFKGVTEDWTTPSLSTSKLQPVPSLRAYLDDEDGYTVELLKVQWRWGDPLDLYIIKPKGTKKPPVVLYLYNYLSDTDTFKSPEWQKSVTKDGFAAVGFVSALSGHRYHDRPMTQWFVSELQESLAVSAHDVQMVLDYLATRGDLDMDRVGMFGQGSGASIAILASAVDPRIKVLDTIDPWGDWATWMAKSPIIPDEERSGLEKPEFLKKVALLEPVDWMPKVQAKKFRLQDATFEPSTPASAKEKLRAAVPKGGVVVIYKTPEDFNAVIRADKALQWLHTELRALPEAGVTSASTLQKK